MRRLILLLVLTGGLYWSWSTGLLAELLTPPAQAGAPRAGGDPLGPGGGIAGGAGDGYLSPADLDLGDVPGGGNPDGVGDLRGGDLGQRGLQGLGALGRMTPGEFAEAVASGRPEALEAAFLVSRRLAGNGPAQAEAARSIAAAAARFAAGADLDLAVSALGEGNSFLHTPEGRQLAESLIRRVTEQPAERAVKLFTGMLERCMRGDLAPEDTEALTLVDKIQQAHRIPVFQYLCDPTNLARAKSYRVKRGDSLGRICNRFRAEDKIAMSPELLGALNRIHNTSILHIDQQLKIPMDPVVTVVEKRSFLMALYVGDVIFRLYRIGHGEQGRTPVAEFVVQEKLEKPDWYSPEGPRYPHGHPKNILGGYFIKLRHEAFQGFGVHGTPEPDSIGKMGSAGCIRMRDGDIREYFQLVPRGSRLIVRDSRG